MSSASAEYSSGPVTPSMWNAPAWSWWPSERHSRAVCTSSSRPGPASNSSSPVVAQVPDHGVGDVGVDVEAGGARPASRREHSWPRIVRHGNAAPCSPSVLRALEREVERLVAPAQRVGGGPRLGVGEHREHVRLGVPERVAVVAGAGQALGRDRAALGPRAGLQRVEEREPHGLLELPVAVDLDVGVRPEVVEEVALALQQRFPAGALGGRDGGVDLVAHRRQRALARPAVGEELREPQDVVRAEFGRQPHAPEIGRGLGAGDQPVDLLDHVVHPGRHPQPGLARAVHEHDPRARAPPAPRRPAGAHRGGGARIVALGGARLVGDELGLRDDAQRPAVARRAPRSGSRPPSAGRS